MKLFKRILALGLCLVFATTIITACGTSNTSSDSATTGGEGGAESVEIIDDGKTPVKFMVNGSAEELAIYEKAVNAFNDQSEDTHVYLIGVTGDDYSAQLMTQLQSKDAPDCFYSEEGTYGELNKSGVLQDLTSYLNDSSSALTMSEIPQNIADNYTFDGAITGVPVDCNPEVIYYNKNLFEELNIKTPTEYMEEGAWNFENFQTVCEQIKAADKIPFVWENWWGPAYSFMLSQGDSLYTADGDANIDTDRVKDGVAYLESNMRDKNFVYAGSLESGESADTLFLAGDTAMVYAGRWSVPAFSEADFTFDVATFPYYKEESNAISAMPATPMVMNAGTENADAVWEFMAFYCGKEGQNLRMEGQGNAVPTIEGLEDIVLTGTPEHAQVFLDVVDIAFLYPQVENLNPGLTDILTGEIEAMLVGDQDAEATVKNMQEKAQELIDSNK